MQTTFTSESVCAGHPDKICDQISDAIVDSALAQDKYSRVAVETMVSKNFIALAGEVTTKGKINYETIARKVIKDLGYTDPVWNFSYKSPIVVKAHTQSPEIAQGVDKMGAGDQGCIKEGSLIRTRAGFVPIEEIKPNDFALTSSGFQRVLAAKRTGVKKIIKLEFINGMILECTKDHKILCYKKKGGTYWREAGMLTKNDYICGIKAFDNIGFSEYKTSHVNKADYFSKYNHKIFGPEKLILNEDIGYLIGVIIGDGCATDQKYIEIAFGNEIQYAEQVKKIANTYFGEHFRMIKGKSDIRLKIDSVVVRKHFENFGIQYAKSSNKKTPKSILTSSKKVISAYIRGLFDTDGTIVENTGRNKKNIRIRLSSNSYRLLQETQLLLNQFGITASILFNRQKGTPVGKDKRYKSNYINYVLSLRGYESYVRFCREIGFKHPHKLKRMHNYLKNMGKKPRNSRGIYLIPHPYKNELIDEQKLNMSIPYGILKIRKKISGPDAAVYDLAIDKTHMFSANGIFVHNCMFGYASEETENYMPVTIELAHKIAMKIDEMRTSKKLSYLRPDGKTQITARYENGKPKSIETVVIAVPHDEKITLAQVKKDVLERVVNPVLEEYGFKISMKQLIVNGTGIWHIGGPGSDTGVTGRKIIVDSYGSIAHVGGGAFSGKDPTKVDRSAAYAARFLAKNIVAHGLATKCEVRLAYFIGALKPVMQEAETFGTAKKSDKIIKSFMDKILDTSLKGILDGLNLRRPIYLKTAAYGHFGRNEFPWEKILTF